ncbi:MAG: enoyl-CoA hydratase [Chloroflexi bacterium]|nr:enoyl-CoA hydratase [Chloroflexota bacterium]
MSDPLVLTEVRDRVGLARLNNPRAYNALSPDLMRTLVDTLRAWDADDNIGAMVITGNEKVFAAGADVKTMSQASAVEMLYSGYIELFDVLATIRKPIIAAVAGWALGGGLELALACDIIIAAENAKFGQPEINLGIIPGAGGTQRLARTLGKYLTMEMVLNDRRLSAEEAARFGLVNRVVPVESYLDEALALARQIAARAPVAVRLGKEAVNYAFESTLSAGLAHERRLFYLLFATEDQSEGMRAFLEKREPTWRGQ